MTDYSLLSASANVTSPGETWVSRQLDKSIWSMIHRAEDRQEQKRALSRPDPEPAPSWAVGLEMNGYGQ